MTVSMAEAISIYVEEHGGVSIISTRPTRMPYLPTHLPCPEISDRCTTTKVPTGFHERALICKTDLAPAAKKARGRPPTFDWDTINRHFEQRIRLAGEPQTQAESVRNITDIVLHLGYKDVDESTIRNFLHVIRPRLLRNRSK